MPTANVRYGRPKGSGLDDRQQLESIAALLAANPKLKPTTAIRSLGVDDPSAIRRLRDKFRIEQAKLMADARRASAATARTRSRISSNENTPAPTALRSRSRSGRDAELRARAGTPRPASGAYFAAWCDLGFAPSTPPSRRQVGLHAVLARPAGRLRGNARSARAQRRRRRRLHPQQDAPRASSIEKPLTLTIKQERVT